MNHEIRIGCGAGFASDRVPPAVDLVERGALDVLVLECLAERTIAAAHARRLAGGSAFDPMLVRRMRALLGPATRQGTRIVSNMGAADPVAAGEQTIAIARELGLPLRVAVVVGDDVTRLVDAGAPAWEDGTPLVAHGEIISANAYLGADLVARALDTGADVVLTGRVADPSLFVAPIAREHGLDLDDARAIGRATVVGHLLECGMQLTGGYFATSRRPVPGLADLGYPIAEVAVDGSVVVTKLPGTGGMVTRATVIEQLVYEVTDPGAYVTPDVTADFRGVRVEDLGADRVRVDGASGSARPEGLKVSVGYRAGFAAEAGISYYGSDALDRARMAAEIVRVRIDDAVELRVELIGGTEPIAPATTASARLRVACRVPDAQQAHEVVDEVTALYTAGPAAGGGVRGRVEPVIGVVSTGISRDLIEPDVILLETA